MLEIPLLALLAAPASAAALLARLWAARALGMRGIRFSGGRIEDPAAAAAWRRAAVVLASLIASYLVACALFAAALLMGGRLVSSTEVEVKPGSRAAAAGMESGDRVVSIAGAPIATWDDLSAAVRAHPDVPTEVVVVRGGEERRFTVTPEGSPGGNAKIGVVSVMKRERPGPVALVGMAVTMPAQVLVAAAKGWYAFFSGKTPGEAAGTVTIVRETAKAANRGPADALDLVGALVAYVWPLSAIVALAFVPRRVREKATGR